VRGAAPFLGILGVLLLQLAPYYWWHIKARQWPRDIAWHFALLWFIGGMMVYFWET
jgi:hypothetical protein